MMADPPVRITVLPPAVTSPTTITLQYPLDPEHDDLLRRIHDEYRGLKVIEDRMHDGQYALRDLRDPVDDLIHGVWLVVADIPDPRTGPGARKWSLRHWPGTDSRIVGTHDAPSLMSPGHQLQQEYTALRMGECGGFTGVPERSVAPRTRSDVVAFNSAGKPCATVEIQISYLHESEAARRDRAVVKEGIPPFWLGSTDNRPLWAPRLAWVGVNKIQGLAPRTWTAASGYRVLEYLPCRHLAQEFCPDGEHDCGRKHLVWQPRKLVVDDLVHGVLTGEYVRFDTAVKQGVVVTKPVDRDRWIDHNGRPAEAVPRPSARPRPLVGIRHNEISPEKLRERISGDTASQGSLFPQLELCQRCGKALWKLADGLCPEHWRHLGMDAP